VPVDVHAPPHVGSRAISVWQALPPWYSARSHSTNCRKFFALRSFFCSLIIWWFLFFVGIYHSQGLWHEVAMEREPHAFREEIEQPVVSCSVVSPFNYKLNRKTHWSIVLRGTNQSAIVSTFSLFINWFSRNNSK
jgi:hypothetical protein